MKHNYKVARRIYCSIYKSTVEQFKMYVNSLQPVEINEIENNFQVNGDNLLSVRDTKSVTELFHSFAVFYYINGRLPYTDRHLFVPDREILQEIQGEKLSLKELFAKIFRTKSNGLAYAPFLAALLLFSAGKQSLVRTSSQNYIETEYLNTLILELSTY